MKTYSGNFVALLIAVLLTLVTAGAHANISAKIDRNDIAMGETVRLIVTGDDGEDPSDIDLTQLSTDFEILQRSSATSARMVNGDHSITRTLELELAPKREGILTIPSLAAGGRQTTPIAVRVSPAKAMANGDALVFFDAEIDHEEGYVQAQYLLTVTLQQAINLDNRAVSELAIPDADIQELEQRSYQRRVNGRLWQVTELRYAVFPQKSGELKIPPLTFTGREVIPGRSLLGARLGQLIRLQTDELTLKVKPVPTSFPGSTWLPARKLSLSDTWSQAPGTMQVGDSSTRTITIVADGLQASQLPPVASATADGSAQDLRFYPDQEAIDQEEVSGGLRAKRVQSEALVATQGGNWNLAEIVIPWWNVDTDKLEYARIPATEVRIQSAVADSPADVAIPPQGTLVVGDGQARLIWQISTAVGWVLTLVFFALWWRQRGIAPSTTPAAKTVVKPHRALVELRLACQDASYDAIRKAMVVWAKQHYEDDSLNTLKSIKDICSPPLRDLLDSLDEAQFSSQTASFEADALYHAARDEPQRKLDKNSVSLSLYPAAT